MHLSPRPVDLVAISSKTVDSLFYVSPIVCEGFMFGLCLVMQIRSVLSSFAIIFTRKRELIALH